MGIYLSFFFFIFQNYVSNRNTPFKIHMRIGTHYFFFYEVPFLKLG